MMTAASMAVVAAINMSAPATNVYADQLMREAIVVADATWAEWGAPAIAPVELRVYDEPDRPDTFAVARATTGGNTVYIDRKWRDTIWRLANDRKRPITVRRAALAAACTDLTHERGHNHGLEHTETGIMHSPATFTPWRCARWGADWIISRRKTKHV